MKRVYCRDCSQFEFWQAVEQQPLIHRPMRRLDWSLAIVLGTYFAVLAFVIGRFA